MLYLEPESSGCRSCGDWDPLTPILNLTLTLTLTTTPWFKPHSVIKFHEKQTSLTQTLTRPIILKEMRGDRELVLLACRINRGGRGLEAMPMVTVCERARDVRWCLVAHSERDRPLYPRGLGPRGIVAS